MLAIFISGLANLSIEQRVREIGVRKVLGAGIWQITRLLSTDFIRLVIVAFAIACPIAWYVASKWLQDYAYRIQLSWSLFGTVGAFIFFVALFTVGIRAARSAMANPTASLRSE